MTPYAPTPRTLAADARQESWDHQQEAYLPDRKERAVAALR